MTTPPLRLLLLLLLLLPLASPTSIPLTRLPHNTRAFVPPHLRSEKRSGTTAPLTTFSPLGSSRTSVPLVGQIIGLGVFYAEISIGGQPFNVQVDTGSSTLAIYDRQCSRCSHHVHSAYDASKSSTFEQVKCTDDGCVSCSSILPSQCDYYVHYVDQSGVSGALGKDIVTIGDVSARATFGRILHEDGEFESYAVDGILGTAFERLNCNPSCYSTVLKAMSRESDLPLVYGMCLTPEGGHWDLGFVNEERVVEGTIQYVNIPRSSQGRYYGVNLHHMRIGGTEVGVSSVHHNVKTIVDSGTTIMYYPTAIISAMGAAWEHEARALPGYDAIMAADNGCAHISAEEADQWPELEFFFKDEPSGRIVRMAMRGSQYLMEIPGYGRCVLATTIPHLETEIILGDIFMQSGYIVFDHANQRVGFSSNVTNCTVDVPFDIVDPGETDSNERSSIEQLATVVVGALALIVAIIAAFIARRKNGAAQFARFEGSAPQPAGGTTVELRSIPPAVVSGPVSVAPATSTRRAPEGGTSYSAVAAVADEDELDDASPPQETSTV